MNQTLDAKIQWNWKMLMNLILNDVIVEFLSHRQVLKFSEIEILNKDMTISHNRLSNLAYKNLFLGRSCKCYSKIC